MCCWCLPRSDRLHCYCVAMQGVSEMSGAIKSPVGVVEGKVVGNMPRRSQMSRRATGKCHSSPSIIETWSIAVLIFGVCSQKLNKSSLSKERVERVVKILEPVFAWLSWHALLHFPHTPQFWSTSSLSLFTLLSPALRQNSSPPHHPFCQIPPSSL